MTHQRPGHALTPDEIAMQLQMHPDVVRRMLRRGEIPARKVGRLWRTDEAVFAAWLRRREGRQFMEEQRIVSHPDVMAGKPTIEGTRITVQFILEELGGGLTIEEFMDQYEVTREQICAALAFAASHLDSEPHNQASA